MVKRGAGEIAKKILDVFADSLGEKWGIQDVAKKADVSWDSTKRHLETFSKLCILRETMEEGKPVYQKIRHTELDTLFSIPLSEEYKITIRKIYATIKKVWNDSIKKPL